MWLNPHALLLQERMACHESAMAMFVSGRTDMRGLEYATIYCEDRYR